MRGIFNFPTDDTAQFPLYLPVDSSILNAVLSHGFPPVKKAYTRDLFHYIGFNLIAFFNIIIIFKHKAALKAGLDFFYVVIETLDRRESAFVYDDTVTDQSGSAAS